MEDFLIRWSILIPLLPLVGALVSGLLMTGRRKVLAHWPIWIGVGLAGVHSILLLAGMIAETRSAGGGLVGFVQPYWTWLAAGDFSVQWGYFFDPLTAVMLCVVCGIGFLITLFAAGYMKGEGGYFRFFAYLGLFIFAMTNLVMGENLIMLYLGWEGVGLCSYLLIGYYYEKPAAREAAKKAFLVNRVGDFGFLIGILLSFHLFGTVSFFGSGIEGQADGLLEMAMNPAAHLTADQMWLFHLIPFCLMVGAFGKSAQFPLHVWLPDAMEGPTPVSALIHAATMVTAGVYMIARCGTLFVGNEAAMWTIAVIGTITALLGATIALRQFDLKKVFAYSTVSQLGFMFVAVGVLAPVAGVFHLVTHAFFKALLFLGSGVVMHAMLGHLDMRKMSGLKHVLPKTRWLMLIGCLALAGVPLFSGFFSKDEIVAAAWHSHVVLGVLLLLTAFLTAYYTFRLYFRVFEGPQLVPDAPAEDHHAAEDDHAHGAPGGHGHDAHHHNHEPSIMIVPLVVLAIGAVLAGYLNFPARALGDFLGQSASLRHAYTVATDAHAMHPGDAAAHAPNPVSFGQEDLRDAATIDAEHTAHYVFMAVSALIALAGIGLAYWLHLKDRRRGEALPEKAAPISRLLEAKYWLDEIYQGYIVEPLRWVGRASFVIDRFIIDGVVWMIGFVPQLGGFALKLTTQSGYLQRYAVTMLLCIAVILLFVFFGVR